MTEKEIIAHNEALEMAAQLARDRGEHSLSAKILILKKPTQ